MTTLGVIVCAVTVGICVGGFLSKRRALPLSGWLALLVLLVAEALMFRGVEPVATYFTPIAWTAYLFLVDAAIFALRGASPMRERPMEVARMAFLSIPLWLIFEAYNLRLANWAYVGLPLNLAASLFGYVWSFATITPALLFTAEFLMALGWFSELRRPLLVSRPAENVLLAAGAACLIVPVIVPPRVGAYLFCLVWLGFVFLLDPLLRRMGAPSLLVELAQGRWNRLCALLASGWICGWLWEFWNFWAAARWEYVFPIFQRGKIFAMPAPGYLGFLSFGVEAYLLYVFAARLLRWPVLFVASAEHLSGHEVRG